MAAEKSKPRLISKEGANRLRWGAVVAGFIGLVAEVAAVAVVGAAVVGTTVVYDIYRNRRERKKH